ncbi:MAG TPA: arginine--tRNA ligase [Streptosporangiaceae bacterium]
MTPDQLSQAILTAAAAALDDLGGDARRLPATAGLDRPRNPQHGDYASNLALQYAGAAGVTPRDLATATAARLAVDPAIRDVQVAGPGFLNITLSAAAMGSLAGTIVGLDEAYGRGAALAGQRLNLEFVSANPTGPVTLASARWAAVGDSLARLLTAQGAAVTTEYYFNDAGTQIHNFARSLLAAARREPVPDNGYAGAYIADIAAAITAHDPGAAGRADALETFRAEGVAQMFDEIQTSLAEFGVHFDVYFSERDLHDRGELASALAMLADRGYLYEADGATWVRTTAFGDDKDRVVRRSDGSYAYFAADCAYYLDKRARGFDKVMIVLGADHHGYVGRMRAVAACFGDDPGQTLEILIGQFVRLLSGGQAVRMSKRAGQVITLGDLVSAIGADAARYALARYSMDSAIDIDLDLWARRSSDNPVFYVQYAHARICSLLRAATTAGVAKGDGYDPALLSHEQESDVLRLLGEFPEVVASAAELRQPHRVARYLEQLAGTYHRFYDARRVLPLDGEPGPGVTAARLWLAEATAIVLRNGLYLLGVTAPARM